MFKVTVTQIDKDQDQEIVVRCHTINSEVVSIMEKLRQGDAVTLGTKDGKTYQISIMDIYYIESVDNKTYIYLQKDVYETKLKLYELEELLNEKHFLRVSKSTILNLMKISSIKPAMNGRFTAVLSSNEQVIISRKYVPDLKRALKGEN